MSLSKILAKLIITLVTIVFDNKTLPPRLIGQNKLISFCLKIEHTVNLTDDPRGFIR